ncbi:MAG: flagellar protein [Eubacteriales bacterium]|nr:flagellar protein [Lachnospiraceae bacterium]MDO5126662.1 flagellar protein [Eubacteriales bacterium]
MELMNCRNCKLLFNYITGEYLCPVCKQMLEDKFEEVRRYIEDNPGKNIKEVSDNCDVTVKQLKKWVRESRLVFSDDSLVGLECERCGRMIHSGRFCNKCAGSLADSMTAAYKKDEAYKEKLNNVAKMRFLE